MQCQHIFIQATNTMLPTAKIPVPTDNYDTPHALVESITSLRAMAVAVDAALDALEVSVKEQSGRVDVLVGRADAYRRHVDKLAAEDQQQGRGQDGMQDEGGGAEGRVGCLPQETGPPLRLELPASYDRAIGRASHQDHEEEINESTRNAAAAVHRTSVMAAAREAARAAVRDVLRRDRELDDGRAVLSDAWLDRPTAFDEAAECAAAVESMAVPSLRSQTLTPADEVAWYGQVAADAAEAAAASSSSGGVGGSAAKSSTGASSEEDDYDDTASVRTGMTGMTLSSRMTANAAIAADGSYVGGAVERRRQRQQAQLERRRRQRRRDHQQHGGVGDAGQGGAAAAAAAAQASVEDIFDRASAVRQQVLSGSLPYLADVLHDAYGCENSGNHSRPQTADELVAFSAIPPPSSRK
jgi:hypothetical protein